MKKSFKDISWDVTEPEYRADPALSYSTLAKFERDGRFNSLEHLFDKVSTPSLTFGSMVDALMTGSQEEFDELFMVVDFPPISDSLKQIAQTLYMRYGKPITKEEALMGAMHYDRFEEIPDAILSAVGVECGYYASAKYEKYRIKQIRENCAQHYSLMLLAEGKTVVDQKDVDDARACVEALKTNPRTAFYFREDSSFEPDIERLYQLKFKGVDDERHVNYRSMADLIVVDYKNKTIQPVDLKTSSHTEWEFYKSFKDWRYDIQARLYWRNIRQNMDKDDFFKDFKLLDYKFIVVNRNTLQPMVWDFDMTQTTGTLDIPNKWGTVYHFRDPYEIGEELQWYLNHPDTKIPREMKEENDILYFLKNY